MSENEISKLVFESGLKIHRKLGVGLYEMVYEECLVYELKKTGDKSWKTKKYFNRIWRIGYWESI